MATIWFDSPRTPVCCSVFEQYVALKLGIHVTIILPPRGEPDLSVTSLEELRANLTAIDIENAKASYEEDEIKVKHEIRTTSSFEKVNEAVKGAMEVSPYEERPDLS